MPLRKPRPGHGEDPGDISWDSLSGTGGRSGNENKPGIFFEYGSFGGEELSKDERRSIERKGLEEAYRQFTGNDPTETTTDRDLKKGILSHLDPEDRGKNVRFRLVVVNINSETSTSEFTQRTLQVDKFLDKSRERFLDKAISRLTSLDATRGEGKELYDALVKAQERGFLNESHQTALAELNNRRAGSEDESRNFVIGSGQKTSAQPKVRPAAQNDPKLTGEPKREEATRLREELIRQPRTSYVR